jgi:hypothetical protein
MAEPADGGCGIRQIAGLLAVFETCRSFSQHWKC